MATHLSGEIRVPARVFHMSRHMVELAATRCQPLATGRDLRGSGRLATRESGLARSALFIQFDRAM